jgi:hypothetical protein
MPATLEADAGPFADLIPKTLLGGENGAPAEQIVGGKFSAVPKAEINTPTDYGAFTDLVPDPLKTGGDVAGANDYGVFSDLIPKSPTSETERAAAEMPEPTAVLDKMALGVEKSIPPFHEAMNAARSLAAGAGKYIFQGLQGFELNRAKLLANPVPEMVKPQADDLILPDGSVMSKQQQDELEKKFHDEYIAQIPDAKAKADLFKQMSENTDTAMYVDPKLAQTIPARIAHSAGSAGVMAVESLIPYAGVPLMVMHGAMATEAEAKNAGQTDEQAEAAGVRSAIGLALFGGASKLAALGVAKLLPEGASTLTKFLSQFTGQEVANETSSRAINGWEAAANAPPGKKIEAALNAMKDETLEQRTLNTVYALAHATNVAKETPTRPVSESQPQIFPQAPEIASATAGEPIEQKPMAEVLKQEQQPPPVGFARLPPAGDFPEQFVTTGEPNAVPESTPVGLGTHAGGDEGVGLAGESQTVGSREQTVPQTAEETGQTQKEPIGVADAIAEIQRRNAPDEQHVSAIANRYVQERIAKGEVGEVAPGQGFSTTDLTALGLQMSPEEVTQHVSNLMQNAGGDPKLQAAAVRAEEARLSERSAALSRVSEANPTDTNARIAADNAFKDLQDFHNGPIAKLKQDWHAQGMSLQGEIPIDLSTFNGLREAWLKDTGEAPPASMEPTLRRTAQNVSESIAAENGAMSRLSREIEQTSRGKKLPTADEVRNRIREEMGLGPCLI